MHALLCKPMTCSQHAGPRQVCGIQIRAELCISLPLHRAVVRGLHQYAQTKAEADSRSAACLV
jgi:hypothetical protein